MQHKLPLLFLPGLLNSSKIWRDQVEKLADLTTSIVGDLTVADSISGLAEAVLADAPDRFALAGLSMGGYVAFEIIRTAPDRVERLALLDTTARPDAAEQSAKRTVLVAQARSEGLDPVIPQLLPGFLSPDGAQDPAMVQAVSEMAHEVGAEAFGRQQSAIMGRPDSRPDLPGIACPTLVIVGAEDTMTGGEIAQEMVDGIPGAVLAEIPNAGHLSPLENPEAVTAALREWLA
jgi:pimeloyl-ACP methyl ester carboxylesterase